MKLDIEITEEEVRSAIERKIRVAVAEYSASWPAETYIKATIKKYWNELTDKVIKEEIENLPVLRTKVQGALENKIRAQLQKVMKGVNNG